MSTPTGGPTARVRRRRALAGLAVLLVTVVAVAVFLHANGGPSRPSSQDVIARGTGAPTGLSAPTATAPAGQGQSDAHVGERPSGHRASGLRR